MNLLDVKLEIIDTAIPKLERLAERHPRQFRRSLKSVGYWLRQEIVQGIEEEAPGGQPYAPYPDFSRTRLLDAMRGRDKIKSGARYYAPRRLSDLKPMGKLKQATRYKFYGDSNRVLIGWISANARRLGVKQELGDKTPLTPKMRRFFWAAGIPLSGKSHLLIPARPTIRPVYQRRRTEVPKFIDAKITELLEEENLR